MIFASDNWAGAHPAIAAGLTAHSAGYARAYGNGDLDRAVKETFCTIFERDVAVFFVSTGTAANALSLVAVNRPGGVAFCHREAHMTEDEGGAPEYFTGGGRLCRVDGPLGRMSPAELDRAVQRYPAEFVHSGRPMAVSVTQATEVGTVYALDDIDAVASVARRHGLPLHMDGARFANALVSLGVSPAEMTWKRGVDLLSFGGTKNGCWCAEAVVLFDPAMAAEFAFIHKRAAQLFSKARFVSAQFEAYFRDGLWLETARHSNAMAASLADGFRTSGAARLAWEPQANEVFAILSQDVAARLQGAGAVFHPWHAPAGYTGAMAADEAVYRFVTSFATTARDVEAFRALL
ncbi:threonine aldolase family protein [Aquibium microcysteis]|uniref:threonine aldolase family protein n=1 Tax=Aquibium microcysteis TaxID=675281 RepID=UPI00165D164F|nr:low specificity L-threonine aldolase [Aquibium microcysteis]